MNIRFGLLGMITLGAAALMVVAVGVGSSFMPPERVLAALLGTGTRTEGIIVWNLRLPRVLLAASAGVALALAGALLQRATRNPLASPSILGLVDGAALGVLVFLFVFSNEANALLVSIHWQPVAAATGAFTFAAAVGVLFRLDGGGTLRLILYGVALAALANAMVVLMMIAGPVYRASQALIWLAGSVQSADWQDVAILSAALGLLVPITLLLTPRINQMRLDDNSAWSTGLSVTTTRGAMLLLSVTLAALAVSMVGGVGFVGLIAPHMAGRVLGTDARLQLPGAAMLGAVMVVGADMLARLAFQPLEVPAGALTALIGAPYFLYILMRQGRHDV